MPGQGTNAKGLGCIVAGKEDIDALLFGRKEGVMGAFASDQSVQPLLGSFCHHPASASGHYTDATDAQGPACEDLGRGAKHRIESLQEFPTSEIDRAFDANGKTLILAEGFLDREAKRAGQLVIVSDFRVCIERQVAGVDCEAVLKGRLELPVAGANPSLGAVPKQPMMNDEDIRV